MDYPGMLTGEHFLLGDHAIAEGAIAGGCRFFAGYPITPSTEVAERMAERLPETGGIYVQMEDEIASIAAILGGAWAGKKTMTTTSGPGFSLMMENLGLGVITETPTVICNVQRAGPSTGLPTMVGQGDMMQARWGSHGDYSLIAVTPWSGQECFDLTVRAFNLAERYRVPVLVMADGEIGHLTEKIVIPPASQIELWHRKLPTKPPGQAMAFEPDADLVPPMPPVGQGYKVMVDSLTHNEQGYPVLTPEVHQHLIKRLMDKIHVNRHDIYDYVEKDVDGADVVVLAYGISARIATRAVKMAKDKGAKVGLIRLKTVWPFPEERVREIASRVKGMVVPEINMGQIVREVERLAVDKCRIASVTHAGGEVHQPEEVLEAIYSVIDNKAPSRADLVAAR